jgi:hypothetical protein
LVVASVTISDFFNAIEARQAKTTAPPLVVAEHFAVLAYKINVLEKNQAGARSSAS